MKFEFGLKGRDWIWLYLPGWFISVVPNFVPHIFYPKMIADPKIIAANPKTFSHLLVFGILFGFISIIISLSLYMPILRKFIGRTRIDGEAFKFSGKILNFIFLVLGNGILSFITFGIYIPWFLRNMHRYITKNIEFKMNRFGFLGEALYLLFLAIIAFLPFFVILTSVSSIAAKFFHPNDLHYDIFVMIILEITLFIVMTPLFYLYNKWIVNFSYKNFIIKWDTHALPSILKILQEFLLTIITIGIYAPAAFAKLYRYFINRTVISQNGTNVYSLKADVDSWKFWKVTWVQLLLTIITLGIYGAWALCKVVGLYVNTTSIEKVGPVEQASA